MKKPVKNLYQSIAYALVFSILASYIPILAQESSEKDLGLSLSSLLNMDITVASDKAEKNSDAAGTVTAYSADDLHQFGYINLRQLADFTPGYSARNTSENWSLETRGGTASLNEKHLIRIDGIPVNHVRNNMAFISEELPLLFAQRVELLRGPASSLYGIGAFNGVMNLVPKNLTQNGTLIETNFSLGSEFLRDSLNGFGNYNKEGTLVMNKRALANVLNKTDNQELQVSLGVYEKDPDLLMYEKRGGPDRNQRKSTFGRISEKLNIGSLGDVTLGLINMETEHGYGTSWAGKSAPANYQRWTTLIPYVKHNLNFTDKASLESYVKYNESREAGLQSNLSGWWARPDTSGIFDYSVMTLNWEGYTKLKYDITEKISVLAGLNYDVRWQDSSQSRTNESNKPFLSTTLYNKKAHTYSAFAQVRDDINILKGLILTAGIRSDNGLLDGNSYHQLSPRLAAVQKVTDELNLKLMYGTALKAPGQDNISHNNEKYSALVLYNDTNHINQTLSISDLSSETIQTFEGNLTYTNKRFYISGTGFYNVIKNQIQRVNFKRKDSVNVNITGLPDYFLNTADKQKSFGGELETQVFVTKDIRLWVNGSYTKTQDEKDTPLAGIPPLKCNVAVNYNTPIGLNVFAVLKATPNFTAPIAATDSVSATANTAFIPAKTAEPDHTISGLYIIDLNFTQKISKNINAELNLANLLDKDFPESIGAAYPGRTVTVTLNTHF